MAVTLTSAELAEAVGVDSTTATPPTRRGETRNFYGEFEPGPVVETIYPARVLPLSLEDSDFVGGVSLLERLKVFVPRGIARRRGEGEALAWAGSVLTWNGEPLRWGGGDGTLIDAIRFRSWRRSMIAKPTSWCTRVPRMSSRSPKAGRDTRVPSRYGRRDRAVAVVEAREAG